MIGAAWGIGFVLGPAAGGLLGGVDPRLPFWVAGALALLNAAYGAFVLPESLPPERRVARIPWSKANPMGSLRLLRSHPELSGLTSVMTLYFLGHQVLPSVCVLYAGYRYGWEPTQMGAVLAAVGICNIIVQAVIVKPYVKRFGERITLFTGLACGMAGFAIYGLAPTGVIFWIGVPVFAGIGLFSPAAQALMTRHVSPQEQGQLQGANGAIMGLTGIFGPALFTLTFAYFIDPQRSVHLPGAPFLLAAALTLGALLLALRVARPVVLPPSIDVAVPSPHE
jgi:DHA1 family tetracycline resistance protein-like MFS transporter